MFEGSLQSRVMVPTTIFPGCGMLFAAAATPFLNPNPHRIPGKLF